MYVPAHFRPDDETVRQLLSAGGFAHLVTPTPDGLVATPLPVLYDAERNALLGHVARTNEHWRHAGGEADSLAILPGPDAYVSPAWYPSKAEHGRVVPTWNYEVLHVHGRLVAHDDPEWLRAFVDRLTDRHETQRTDAAPMWSVGDAPEAFLAGQLRAIVGLELVVSRVEGKAKLSQNRPPADQVAVVAALGASSAPTDRAVAARMHEAGVGTNS